VQLLPHAADHADCLAEIDLGVPRRVHQRHERLAQPPFGGPHVILHGRITASVAVLRLEPLEDPQRRMPLLGRRRLVRLQDRIDDGQQGPELRLPGWLRPHIPRRCRIPAHPSDRIPAQPEKAGGLSAALAFNEYKLPNRRVLLHGIHPRQSLRIGKGSA